MSFNDLRTRIISTDERQAVLLSHNTDGALRLLINGEWTTLTPEVEHQNGKSFVQREKAQSSILVGFRFLSWLQNYQITYISHKTKLHALC